MLTSAKAAKILNAHESSVKRWCNDGQLPFQVTQGGHRRIKFEELIQFAKRQNIEIPLSHFGSDAVSVWNATSNKNKIIANELVTLLLSWLRNNELQLPRRLLDYLIFDIEFPLESIFDQLVYPTMFEVGQLWEKGELSIGTEHLISHNLKRSLHQIQEKLSTTEDWQNRISETSIHTIVGCSEDNQHDIGANCVGIFLSSLGVSVQYLGSSVPIYEYIQFQNRFKADVICISFSPGSNEEQINSLLTILKHCYEPQKPYSLVLGGHPNIDLQKIENSNIPFKSFSFFNTIHQLKEWAISNLDLKIEQ